MRRPLLLALALALATAAALAAADAPSATLKAGEVELHVWLPDADLGWYRGIRFDRSGMVGQATWRGRTFFAELKTPHDPLRHDHGAGPAEEFGIDVPAGFAEAQPGDAFFKIGAVVLKRPDDQPYKFNKAYEVLATPEWTVVREGDAALRFEQVFARDGWGWRYVKTVTAQAEPPALVIARRLENTGTRAIATEHYGHNMLRLAGRTVGPGYELRFAQPVTPAKLHPTLAHDGAVLRVATEVKNSLYTLLKDFPATAEANRVTVATPDAELTIATDAPAARVAIYGERSALCPELFVPVRVEPGQAMEWTTTYGFAEPVAR